MGVLDHKVIVPLLLGFLAFVVVTSVWLVLFIMHWRKHPDNQLPAAFRATSIQSQLYASTCRHLHLRHPESWLAVKSRNLVTVQSALALHNSKPCSWAEGILGGSDEKLFISPPVAGWILVMGSALPDPSEDVDVCFRFLMELSRKLGHVQYFNSNIPLNYHAWVQADAGHVTRAYAWAGRTLWNQGKLTKAENELKMRCFNYTDVVGVQSFGSQDSGATNSDKVHLLAARWSLDPEEIDERFLAQEWGIVGEPSRHY